MRTTGSTIVQSSPPTLGPAPDPGEQLAPRLAELVVHLTDCNPRLAVAAVNAAVGREQAVDADAEGRLAVVAQAMVSVRRQIDLRDRQPGPAALEA